MKRIILGSVLLASAAAALAGEAARSVDHVLVISVDGMHQQDLAKCIAANTCPKIAKLAGHGVNYTNAYTPGLSDSVPGLAALVTGGSPRSTGLLYDDIYDQDSDRQGAHHTGRSDGDSGTRPRAEASRCRQEGRHQGPARPVA